MTSKAARGPTQAKLDRLARGERVLHRLQVELPYAELTEMQSVFSQHGIASYNEFSRRAMRFYHALLKTAKANSSIQFTDTTGRLRKMVLLELTTESEPATKSDQTPQSPGTYASALPR